ncbi:MAG: hypothetical protein ABIA74_00020 [bacterium]
MDKKNFCILFFLCFFNFLNCEINVIPVSQSEDAITLCIDFPKKKRILENKNLSYWCSSSSCKDICFYNTLDGKKKMIFVGGERPIYALSINNLEDCIAFGCSKKVDDKIIDFVIVSDLQEFFHKEFSSFVSLQSHKDLVKCLSWPPANSSFLASGSLDGEVKIWDSLLEKSVIKSLKLDEVTNKIIPVFCLEWGNLYNHDDNLDKSKEVFLKLAAGFSNGSIKVWELKFICGSNYKVEIVKETILKANNGYVGCLNWSNDDKFLVAGYQDGRVRIWDPEAKYRKCVYNSKGHSWGVSGIKFYKDNFHFISTGMDGAIRFWDIKNRKNELLEHLRFDNGVSMQIYCLDIYPSNLFLVVGLIGCALVLDISYLLLHYTFEQSDCDSVSTESETDVETDSDRATNVKLCDGAKDINKTQRSCQFV